MPPACAAVLLRKITLKIQVYFAVALALLGSAVAFTHPATADVLAQAAPPVSPSPSPSPSASPTPNPFQLSFYEEAGYQTSAVSNSYRVISGRVFDTVDGRAQQHAFNVTASYTGPIGYKVEALYGDDAEYIHSYPQALQATGNPPNSLYGQFGPGANLFTVGPGYTSQFDLVQAYVSANTGPLTLIVGKFATLAGAEVIESPSNLNYSRSILFGYAIPFKHLGARLTYAVSPTVSLIGGVNKGWDVTGQGGLPGDNNALTAEFGLAFNPSSFFSLTAQGYSGKLPNPAFTACATLSCVRSLGDVVATFHVTPSLTFIVNGDYGTQSNSVPTTLGTFKSATWNGVAAYLSYAFSPKLTGTVRGELFNDNDGIRSFAVGSPNHWSEVTLTAQYALLPNLTVRAEFRGDHSTQQYFIRKDGLGQQNNTSGNFEFILHAP